MNWKKNWGFAEPSGGIYAARFLTGLWAFCLFAVFPLYMRNRYFALGDEKFRFFFVLSCCCLIPAAVLYACHTLRGRFRGNDLRPSYSALDCAMFLYLAAAALSWAGSIDRAQAWNGVEGWFMGLRTQMILVLSYFLVSRLLTGYPVVLAGHFLGSALVFLLGIGQRFGFDPLGLYEGIGPSYHQQFLSTVGQTSWYSGYVCTVLTVGIVYFYLAEGRKARMCFGLYCLLGFAAVVTLGSDSAFVAMAVILLGLFLVSCTDMERMERFWETVLLMLGSFKLMGIFQIFLPQRAVNPGTLPLSVSQGRFTWILFLVCCLSYTGFLFFRQRHPEKRDIVCGRLLRRATVVTAVVLLSVYVLAVWLNTSGALEAWFGVRSRDPYLFFDRIWGNSRGFIWKFTADVFGELPFLRRWIGVGCDCFSAYCYRSAELSGYLNHFFGHGQRLTNAHNEFLNMMFCTGILGLASYAAIFVLAIRRFWKAAKQASPALMGALAALAYAAHNFFCYQQVCAAPFLFLILGMAENMVRNPQKTAKGY